MTDAYNETLFDDAIVGTLMKVTGADELMARFMLSLHRGFVSGDIAVQGGQFRGTPLRGASTEPVPAGLEVTNPVRQWRVITGSRAGTGPATTLSVSFSDAFEHTLNPVA